MENKDILVAMWDYMDKDRMCFKDIAVWLDADEWIDVLKCKYGINVSRRKIDEVYRQGWLHKRRNKNQWGNSKYHYFPMLRPDKV